MRNLRAIKFAVVSVAWVIVLMPMHAATNEPKSKLLGSVEAYHQAEMEGLWSKAYEFRTADFKRQVTVADFVATMSDASSGWELLEFNMQGTTITAEGVRVHIRFVERPPERFWEGVGVSPRSTLTLDEEGLWVMESGDWKLREAPSRAHLPFAR